MGIIPDFVLDYVSVTTILMYRTGRSRVSAITQTPASGPPGPATTPPMSSLSMATEAACCALTFDYAPTAKAAMPIAATLVKRTCRNVMSSSCRRQTQMGCEIGAILARPRCCSFFKSPARRAFS